MSSNKKEAVTSDSIPDVLGTLDPSELRIRKDKLLQRRLKQNPDLKSKFQIGEQMITTVTFTSGSAFAIDKQYSLLKMMGSEIASNWEFSEISSSSSEDGSTGTESFTITSTVHDNNLTKDYLGNYLMSGVTMDIVQNNDKELEQENIVNSILEMNLDPAKMANLLLGESKVQLENKKLVEQEEPDSKDSESSVIDDVQSMLVKMLPMTKGLDLSPEKEEELKKHIDAALAIFNSDKTEAVDYPQFQFAILVSREDYIDAIRILNDANITPKTSFNDNDKSILAFDEVHSDDAGIAKLTKERVIKILSDSGIAATGAVGLNFMSPVDKEADELDGSDDLDQEDLVARTEAILFGKRKVK